MFMLKYSPSRCALAFILTFGASAFAQSASKPAVTVSPASTQKSLPTADSIKALADAHQYKDAIQSMSLLLDNRSIAGTYDRHAMLMLRAECQFQLLQYIVARSTLDLARKEAEAAGSDDDAAQAASLNFLILKSPTHLYSLLTGPNRKAFDILDPAVREAATACLFADTAAACDQKVKLAKSKLDIAPIIDVSRDFPALRALDRFTHHDTTVTDAFAKDTSNTAAEIIDHNLADDESKIHVIELASDKWITSRATSYNLNGGVSVHEWSHPAGPTSPQISTLNTIKHTCEDLPKHIADLSQIFANPEAFVLKHHFRYWYHWYHDNPDLSAAADDVRERANEVLTKDYSR